MFNKINSLTVVIALVAVFFATASIAYSQAGAESPALTGKVIDSETEQPLAGIQLTIEGTNTRSTTNEKGEFTFAELEPGTYTIVASPEGYKKVTKEVEFHAEDTESEEMLVIELTPST